MQDEVNKKKFGTAPVFFTAISTILGAILFLRFGYAVGNLGFAGVLLIILIGHIVTISTAFAISEIATNAKVEGGGEYYIISRSFGLNLGATVGIALYLSQAISVAFYVIAFTEAFEPIINWAKDSLGIEYFPRQFISIPAMALLAWLMLTKGASMGVKTLYIVVAILFVSLVSFFLGKTGYVPEPDSGGFFSLKNADTKNFFMYFAIIFPAFTGMTAGVGLSGDLAKPSKSIPLGTSLATIAGMIIYIFIAYKLFISESPEKLSDLENHQLIMADIAWGGKILIPLGLAASTISSAIGSLMVAPRTLQALGIDKSFPGKKLNILISKGTGETNEPKQATFLTVIIAFVFVGMGEVDAVAKIISMFFMITYGSICLISFLSHFGADLSYRPSFKSHWIFSLVGFVMCIFLMFLIDPVTALVSIIVMILLHSLISYSHKDRKGMQAIFEGAIFQFNRKIHVFLQNTQKAKAKASWRPSALCISDGTFESDHALQLMSWISHKYGFGTYLHYIKGHFSVSTNDNSKEILNKLIKINEELDSKVYLDTIISPTYTSAIAQLIQLPGISGMENNMMVFEYPKEKPDELKNIVDNFSLVKAADFDICIYRSSRSEIKFKHGIHIWIKSTDALNSNLMILLSYILVCHPKWKNAEISIFELCNEEEIHNTRQNLQKLISEGRLQINQKNVKIIKIDHNVNTKSIICEKSKDAGLTILGFREEILRHDGENTFNGYDDLEHLLFVNSSGEKKINFS